MTESTSHRLSLLALAASAILLGGTAAQAEDVVVVHAIPGTALGLPDDALGVDIAVDGACVFTGVEFSQSAVADLPVGSYDVAVSLTDGACGGPLAVVGSFAVSLGETAVVVANLTEAGSPQLSKIAVDASEGDTRVTFLHGAGAPPVKIAGKFDGTRIRVGRLSNGAASFPAEGEAGNLRVKIKPADGGQAVFRAKGVPVAGNLLIVAAGTLATDTFQPVIVALP